MERSEDYTPPLIDYHPPVHVIDEVLVDRVNLVRKYWDFGLTIDIDTLELVVRGIRGKTNRKYLSIV